MRILDENNIEMQDYDPQKGYVQEDKILVTRHEAIEAIKEQGHYEVVKEYPNGGKDVEWIVDIPAVEGKDAWDEYETILRYIPYNERQLAQIEIDELKGELFNTDYIALKIIEGAATREEYADVIAQRAKWRERINELETKM